MHELIENVANKINPALSIGQGKLAQDFGAMLARRAASHTVQQGATVKEAFDLCESAFREAGDLIATELLWAVDQAVYPSVKFVNELGQMEIDIWSSLVKLPLNIFRRQN